MLRFFKYIADRTDIALGLFNSPPSGYVLTPAEEARIVAGSDRLIEAMDYARESGLDQSAWTWARGSPAIRATGLLHSLHPHTRPQAELPAAAKTQIEKAYSNLGLVRL